MILHTIIIFSKIFLYICMYIVVRKVAVFTFLKINGFCCNLTRKFVRHQVSTNIIADDVVGGDGMIHMIHSYNSVQDILEVVLQDDQQVVVLPDDQWGEEVLQDDHWHGVDEVQDWLYDVEEDKHNH